MEGQFLIQFPDLNKVTDPEPTNWKEDQVPLRKDPAGLVEGLKQ
jgi:hypothetical protein